MILCLLQKKPLRTYSGLLPSPVMEIAAGTVGFVSLTGQALQGCNYLCNIFSDARDAPALIGDISKELCNLRSHLEAFRLLLLKIQDVSPASLTVQPGPTVPLQSCQDAIHKLQIFVDKYLDLSTPTGTVPGSSRTHRDVVRRAWHKFDVARRGDKLRSHRAQLEAAKTFLISAQANIHVALNLQHFDVTSDLRQNLQQLQAAHTASARVVQANRDLAADIFTAQEDNRALTQMTKLSLDQVLSNSQMLLTQSALSKQSAHESTLVFNRMEDALASLSNNLRDGFENLPTTCQPIIQDIIEKALAKHESSPQTALFSADQIPVDASTRLPRASVDNVRICSLSEGTSSESSAVQHGSAASLVRAGLCQAPTKSTARAEDSIQLSKRGPKRQKSSRSVFNVWFGWIEITSSITEQDIDVDRDYIHPIRAQARWTSFKLVPSLWFLQTGLLFESGNSRPTISQPGWDKRLRFIRTHPKDSAVVKAIEEADYIRFRRLLESGEISSFDVAEDKRFSKSLFELAVSTVCEGPGLLDPWKRKSVFDIAKLLADSGSDCHVGWSLCSVANPAQVYNDDIDMKLFRIIMAHSQSDPFEGFSADSESLQRLIPDPSVFVMQDDWDLSELKILFEECRGKGSWEHVVESRESFLRWNGLQKQKWHQMPASLRRSESYCLVEFGWFFCDCYWGQLCWLDERPTFWKSKQSCEEFFGGAFITNEWPTLYWKEELPPFWRSKEACLEAFGSYFVSTEWPELCWKQELPSFWQSRETCREFFGSRFIESSWARCLGETCFDFLEGKGANVRAMESKWWDDKVRNEWIIRMINCWLSDAAPLRHSRQHCIKHYGANFVRVELPYFLRADGLKEEDVLRLTEYGVDMEPPHPRPYWEEVHEHEGGSKVEECRADDRKLGSNSADEDDVDSDGETSDGWETADEG